MINVTNHALERYAERIKELAPSVRECDISDIRIKIDEFRHRLLRIMPKRNYAEREFRSAVYDALTEIRTNAINEFCQDHPGCKHKRFYDI